mmetsp:Transcript_7634/g.18447  ORF Transcript_7634/g.18447 Transcript_7634/m.18447 type:complete len:204 (+) Transcript_7634:1674-2285(+)
MVGRKLLQGPGVHCQRGRQIQPRHDDALAPCLQGQGVVVARLPRGLLHPNATSCTQSPRRRGHFRQRIPQDASMISDCCHVISTSPSSCSSCNYPPIVADVHSTVPATPRSFQKGVRREVDAHQPLFSEALRVQAVVRVFHRDGCLREVGVQDDTARGQIAVRVQGSFLQILPGDAFVPPGITGFAAVLLGEEMGQRVADEVF